MKKSLFLLMLTASFGAYAANHEVKMLDNGKDGSMVFEPGYVNAKVGDTVTFKAANKGHWVQSKALPDGVADSSPKRQRLHPQTRQRRRVRLYLPAAPHDEHERRDSGRQTGEQSQSASRCGRTGKPRHAEQGRLKNTCSRSNKPPHKQKGRLKPLSRFQTTFCQPSSPILIPLPPKSSRSGNR